MGIMVRLNTDNQTNDPGFDPITVKSYHDYSIEILVEQFWSETIANMIAVYRSPSESDRTCDKNNFNVPWGPFKSYNAHCESDGNAFVDIYLLDEGRFGNNGMVVPPTECWDDTEEDNKGWVGFSFKINCLCGQGKRTGVNDIT